MLTFKPHILIILDSEPLMASIRANARKIICIGRNYAYPSLSLPPCSSSPPPPLTAARDHIKELQNTPPKQPFFFLKPPSSILPPNAGPVLRPRGVKLHFEVELGCIIGREVRDLSAEDEEGALSVIDGRSAWL